MDEKKSIEVTPELIEKVVKKSAAEIADCFEEINETTARSVTKMVIQSLLEAAEDVRKKDDSCSP